MSRPEGPSITSILLQSLLHSSWFQAYLYMAWKPSITMHWKGNQILCIWGTWKAKPSKANCLFNESQSLYFSKVRHLIVRCFLWNSFLKEWNQIPVQCVKDLLWASTVRVCTRFSLQIRSAAAGNKNCTHELHETENMCTCLYVYIYVIHSRKQEPAWSAILKGEYRNFVYSFIGPGHNIFSFL